MRHHETVTSISGSAPSLIVGVGASAGGLDACRRFLGALPAEGELAVVIVLHLDPTHESHFVSLLEPVTAMKVVQVGGDQPVAPNCVYVIAPDTSLEIRGGVLHVRTPRDPRIAQKPVDAFFSSLAADQQQRAVAVIFSGMGNDGSAGVQAIKAKGGLCMVQDPESAEHDSMPRNAIATGVADHILAPEEMPTILLAHATQPRHSATAASSQPPPQPEENLPQEFDAILALLASRYQLDFRAYKNGTLMRRTERRMALKHIGNWKQYLAHLDDDPEELGRLYSDLLVGVTQFFRDPDVWRYLEETAVPGLLEGLAKGGPAALRVWVPGCATGEEAYSIAIVFLERLRGMDKAPKLQVFASDVNEDVLAFARRGLYPAEIASDVSAERLRDFFKPQGEHLQVSQQVRETVTFARHNMLTDPPFSRVDMVSCRNVLIYLEQHAQERVLELFQFALRPGGLLVLGSAETIGRRTDAFEIVSKPLRVYRSTAVTRAHASQLWSRRRARASKHMAPAPAPVQGPRLTRIIEQLVLSRHTSACVAINQSYEILFFFGPTHDYLSQPTGQARLDLLSWAKPGLYSRLRSALSDAVERRERVAFSDMRVERGAKTHRVSCTIEPITGIPGAEGLFLVVFQDVPEAPAAAAEAGKVDEPLVRYLEQELKSSRQELQSAVEHLDSTSEEYRASHEELLSLNEELQSSNEELETSKEELQSLNEEMLTINRQLDEKNADFRRLNADLRNLLASTEIPTIFLDRQLDIRWFSPAATEVMRVVPSDVGRSIEHIKERFQDTRLRADAERVLKSLAPIATEVMSEEGKWYVRKVLPYRTEDERIDGVCITFSDVTAQKQATEDSQEARLYAEAIVRTLRTPLLVIDGDARVLSANKAFYDTFHVPKEDTENRVLYELGNRQWDIPALRALFERVLPERKEVSNYDVEHRFEHIGLRLIRLNASLMTRSGRPALILVSLEDITAQQEAERAAGERTDELVQEHRRKDEFLAMFGHELRNPLTALVHGLELLDTAKEGGARAEQVRAMMTRQAKRISIMLDQLLDIARVMSGKIEIANDAVDVAYVATAALETIAPQLRTNKRGLECSLPELGSLRVLGDAVRLTQVLENLLTNAVKYSQEGDRIWLTVESDTDSVRFIVRDSGMGLAADFIPHAFDLFTQAPRSLDRSQGGLGLGLPLVRGIVEMHGGTVAASSPGLGKGSEFVVTLPRMRERRSKPRLGADAKKTPPNTASHRILVIDDEEDVAGALVALLGHRGHQALAANDGATGLAAARTFRPNVVLVDLGMPGMNGYEVGQRIHEEHSGEKILLVAMTGYQQDVARLQAAGFDHHLLKPPDLKQLDLLLAAMEDSDSKLEV